MADGSHTPSEPITLGELREFLSKHDIDDSATVYVDLWDAQHGESNHVAVTSCGVSLFLNGHAELLLHIEPDR